MIDSPEFWLSLLPKKFLPDGKGYKVAKKAITDSAWIFAVAELESLDGLTLGYTVSEEPDQNAYHLGYFNNSELKHGFIIILKGNYYQVHAHCHEIEYD